MLTIIYDYLNILVVAIISTMGAFVPIFILMIIHYLVRKNEYKKQVQKHNMSTEIYNSLIKINNKAIQTIYQSAGVKNGEELFEKMKNVNINASKYFELRDFIEKNIKQKTENYDKISRLLIRKNYLNNYSFRTYISNLLDRRFIE